MVGNEVFKTRPIVLGNIKGETLVSKQGLNRLAAFQESLIRNRKMVIGGDRNDPYVYRKVLTDKILIIPVGIGSTTGSLVLVEAILRDIAPKAVVCTREVDTLTATGAIIAYHWFNKKMVLLDSAGDQILEEIETGETIEISEDGTIRTSR